MLPRSLAALFIVFVVVSSAAADQKTTIGGRVVAFCEKHKGKKVGNGQCTKLAIQALAAAGAEGMGPDSPNEGDYTWGRLIRVMKRDGDGFASQRTSEELRPGDILQFRDARFEGNGSSLAFEHHTAVVAGAEEKGQPLKIFHQNVNPEQTVVEDTVRLDELREGWIRVYRPVPADVASSTQVSQDEVKTSESRKAKDTFFDSYFVFGATRPRVADHCGVTFWNLSGRDLTLTTDGQQHALSAGQSVRLDLKREFTWSVTGRDPQRQQVPAEETGVEIVVRR